MLGQTLLGRYTVEALLGEGGMAAVYRARDAQGNPVAIKLLHKEIASEPNMLARFEREAQALAMLAHPNIAGLHGIGQSEAGDTFVIMEYIEGHELGAELGGGRKLAPGRALAFVRQILGALHHAHQFGLVHRDLKPENVLVTRGPAGEQIKLIDFGLVKLIGDVLGAETVQRLTTTGVVFGTPEYMAPEQMLDQGVDPRTDLYAVGIMLFELLTGRRPFEHEEISVVWRMHLSNPVPRLAEIDPALDHADLDAILQALLAKQPDERFDSALAARRALESIRF
ncbi:MAG: serine/threonine protein kinase [Deltaproteobacteria bacterium]|nr:serine/threonine protein kinase [Deltaproteobacteria bacterium]